MMRASAFTARRADGESSRPVIRHPPRARALAVRPRPSPHAARTHGRCEGPPPGARRWRLPTRTRTASRCERSCSPRSRPPGGARSSGSPRGWAACSRASGSVSRPPCRRDCATGRWSTPTPSCSPTPTRRCARPARAWCAWEDAHVSLTPGSAPSLRFADPEFRLCFARLVTHYWRHAAFLPADHLLHEAGRLDGIPGVLIHGAHDVSSPLDPLGAGEALAHEPAGGSRALRSW